jgi:hypothetical protein
MKVFVPFVSGLAMFASVASAAPVVPTSGARDAITIFSGNNPETYWRVREESGQLELRVNGPTVLTLLVRTIASTEESAAIRVKRDGKLEGDHTFPIVRDPTAKAEFTADVISAAHLIRLQVPNGAHRFSLTPLHGEALAIQVQGGEPLEGLTKERRLAAATIPTPPPAATEKAPAATKPADPFADLPPIQ